LMVGKKKKRQIEKPKDQPKEDLLSALGLHLSLVPEGYTEVEGYSLEAPFSRACIARNEQSSEHLYIVDELLLSPQEREALARLKTIFEKELTAPNEEQSLRDALSEQAPGILSQHREAIRNLNAVELEKVLYYLERNIAGFGKIDAFMFDINIEDISCTGFNKPLFLWHRRYENIRTTITFEEDELNDFVMKLVHKAGKHVSLAFPIVDATLPGKHRLAVTYGKEVTPSGTSFTIRKFRTDPLTIIDLIRMETLSEAMAAYLWMLIENKLSIMIVGATGAGKTTSLNAIASLTNPSYKIITIEEVAEINLSHENWVSTIARPGFGVDRTGEISLYELIKSAVRHRPDLVIVGEIRGEEAYVLFQALATGHGGLCTMHADGVDLALKRLTQPPMNIPQTILPLMNCLVVVKHVRAPIFVDGERKASSRKFVHVAEVKQGGGIQDVAQWIPASDTFSEDIGESYLLNQLALSLDLSMDHLIREIDHRRELLLWMAERNIRDYKGVDEALRHYYNDPSSMIKKTTSGT